MSTSDTSRMPERTISGKRTLQTLRRAAGFRTAKEFADHVGINEYTYARYERQPETPGTRIPMGPAWIIADALGCSIDLVVGRSDIDELASRKETLDARAARLSRASRESLYDFIAFLEHRDAAGSVAGGR